MRNGSNVINPSAMMMLLYAEMCNEAWQPRTLPAAVLVDRRHFLKKLRFDWPISSVRSVLRRE
jgi:hypothetical protein